MKLRTNAFDLWVFHRQDRSPEYLLYHTSQEKADKWFHGGRFWQIPGGFVQEEEELTDAFVRVMAESGL
ncbi:NUDIX domain-containing protein, partial [Candidatus Bipolaricaulota bacterium]|nr:NUDIX domain-containing protein [Candidatus Bipolaricaulota bacterium]